MGATTVNKKEGFDRWFRSIGARASVRCVCEDTKPTDRPSGRSFVGLASLVIAKRVCACVCLPVFTCVWFYNEREGCVDARRATPVVSRTTEASTDRRWGADR